MSRDGLPNQRLVSVVAPFFNEADGTAAFFAELYRAFERCPEILFEVIAVDDGSSDATLERLRSFATSDPRICVLELSRNFGKESALTAGVEFARGDAVIPIDTDLQDPPSLIPALIGAWRDGADVVLARRVDRRSDSLTKRVFANLFYQLHNAVSDLKLPTNVGDFRLMDRQVVNAINQLPETQRFMKGLFAWVGFKTVTIEFVRAPRHGGKSKFSGIRLWNFALEGITSFSTAPLKVWTYAGVVGAFFSFLYASYIVFLTLIRGVAVPGYASLIVVVLFMGSLQLISVGLIGEYLGRVYLESKRRPSYIIRRIHHEDDAADCL